METLKKIIKFLLTFLGIGGFICALFLAIGAKAWVGIVAIGVLGWMAFPTLKRLINELMD